MKHENMTIGFVGVGRMGANMARHLYDEKYKITAIFDTNNSIANKLAKELKAHHCAEVCEVTRLADIIITVVTDDHAMQTIFSSTPALSSLLSSNAKGKLFINCATVSPHMHEMAQKNAHQFGAETLEACMASSIDQARNGTLYLMCAGPKSVFERAKPLLEDLGETIRYVGEVGNAAKVKALVNMVMNINTAGLAEGLGLGAALGLDLTMLREIFSGTGAASRVLQTDGEDMQNRAHDCYFSSEHAAKDSSIALDLAHKHLKTISLPLAEATKAQYKKMVEVGLRELDKSGIAELTFPGRYYHD